MAVVLGLAAALASACGRADEAGAAGAHVQRLPGRGREAAVRDVLERFRGRERHRRRARGRHGDGSAREAEGRGRARGVPRSTCSPRTTSRSAPSGGRRARPAARRRGRPGAVLPAMAPPRFDGTRYFLPFRPNVQVTYANRARLPGGRRRPSAHRHRAPRGRPGLQGEAGCPEDRAPARRGRADRHHGRRAGPGFRGRSLAAQRRGLDRGVRVSRGSLAGRAPGPREPRRQVRHAGGSPRQRDGVARAELAVHLGRAGAAGSPRPVRGLRGVARAGPGRPRRRRGRPGDPARRHGTPPRARGPAGRLPHVTRGPGALVAGNAWPAIRADAYGQVPAAQRETFEAVRRALDDGWHRPGVPYWPDVSDAMNEAVRRILQGGEPVRPVLDRLHAAIGEAARRKGAPYPPPR